MNSRNLQAIALISLIWLTTIPTLSYAESASIDMRLTWSAANDSMPSFLRTNDGRIWVFWHSHRTGDDEIFYKIYNGSNVHPWSPEIRLTYSSGIDGTPHAMQSQDGKIWVAWLRVVAGNFEIFYKVYNGSSWSTDTRLTISAARDELPWILQTSDGKIWVFWDSNVNGNFDIFYRTTVDNGANWTLATLMPRSSTRDDDWDPTVIQDFSGNLWVSWVRNDDVYYSIFDGFSWSPEIKLTSGGLDNWHPSLMQADDGRIWLLWDQGRVEPPVQTDIYYMIYEGSWSPATQLTNHTAEDVGPSIVQDTNGTIWTIWSSTRPDSFYDLYYRTVYTPPEHDVEIFSVLTDKAVVYRGDIVQVEVVARNLGRNPETIQVKSYANLTQIGTKTISNLAPGQLYPFNVTWPTSSFALGNYTVKATATPVAGETNTADNTYIDSMVKITAPDITVTNVTASQNIGIQGFITDINVTVKNKGIRTHTFDLDTYYSSVFIERKSVTLESGKSSNVIFTWNTTNAEKGNHTVSAKAIPLPGEVNTADNTCFDGVVHVKAAYDVVVTGLAPSHNEVVLGESVSFNVTVANQGYMNRTETFTVTFYADSMFTDSQVVTLDPWTYATLTFVWNTSYYLSGYYGLYATASVVAGEIDTIDNNYFDGVVWVKPVDVAVIAVTPLKTKFYQGEVVSINVTVTNEGFRAESFMVTCYANSTFAGSQTVMLLNPGETANVIVLWDTTGFSRGNYSIAANATAVLYETETEDNGFSDGVVRVKFSGDIDDNGSVEYPDLSILVSAYGSNVGMPIWNQDADLNGDDLVGSLDLFLLGNYYGKTAP